MPGHSTPEKQEKFVSFSFKPNHAIAKKAASGTSAAALGHGGKAHKSGNTTKLTARTPKSKVAS